MNKRTTATTTTRPLGTAAGRVTLNLSAKGIRRNWKAIDRMLAAGLQVVVVRS